MSGSHDILFATLADATRRGLFERLCREGEQTVHALTAQAGVSQPAVSKHLGVLKRAGLVLDRREGRETHYSARPGALAPLAIFAVVAASSLATIRWLRGTLTGPATKGPAL